MLFQEDRFISARIRVRAAHGQLGRVVVRNSLEGPATSAAVRIPPAARAPDFRRVLAWA
ncbi:MAG TPA: hypothetical protein VGH38_06625 [Bryobacteraceae bacterium]